MSRSKHKAEKTSLRETMRLSLRGYAYWRRTAPQLLLSILAKGIVEGITPYALLYMSALLINELAGRRDTDMLLRLVLIALVSAAILAFLNACATRWKNREHEPFWFILEQSYAEKLLSLDFGSLEDPHVHDLHSQIKQNINWGGWGLYYLIKCLDPTVKAVTAIIGAIALTVSLFTLPVPQSAGQLVMLNSPLFVAILAVSMCLVTLAAPALSNRATAYIAKGADLSKMANRFFMFFGFMGSHRERALDIRAYRQDRFCTDKLASQNAFSPGSVFAKLAAGPVGGLRAASAAVSRVFTAIVYVFVCLKAWGGAFGVGSVTQYIGAITALAGGLSSLVSVLGELRNNMPFLRTAFEFLDVPNGMYKGSLTVEKRSDRKYEIEFRNVSFKYPGSEVYALRDVSLRFSARQRLAVVGMNGSGKTTFIKLLCRLYDPTEGEILLNGIDIRKYAYHEYMSIFSVVFQDFKLLSFGLGENVAAGMTVDADRAKQCLLEAGFEERLASLPSGLNTLLYKDFDEGGVEVSGGEAQKIALARALYKDAAFIVLDEPTAALDPIAEFDVYSRMNEIVGDKTAVFISHRLSSCRFCHDIVVFHEGRIVQRGGHDELIGDSGGKYFELWNAQARYYAR